MPRWRGLARVLAFGAVYDGVFGLAILAATKPVAARFHLPVPDDPVYLGLNGIFLLILAAIYALAASDAERFASIAPIAAAGRVLGFGLFASVAAMGGSRSFLLLGIADLTIALLTLVAWRRAMALSA
jgi:hypothetical protein